MVSLKDAMRPVSRSMMLSVLPGVADASAIELDRPGGPDHVAHIGGGDDEAEIDIADFLGDLARDERADDKAETPVEPRAEGAGEKHGDGGTALARGNGGDPLQSRLTGGAAASATPVERISAICMAKARIAQMPSYQAVTI